MSKTTFPFKSFLSKMLAGMSLVAALLASALVSANAASPGTVVAWGSNSVGQTTVPASLSGVTAVAAGAQHTVALKSDGTVVAWGLNSSGQTTVPTSLSGVAAIAAGYQHTVALKSDGTVVAWGNNGVGQTTVPTSLSGVTAVAAGDFHTVALKSDGTVVAWGDNGSGQTTVPASLSGVTAVAAGEYHTVALKSDGTVVAWGKNGNGQTTVPTGLSGVTAVTAGGSYTAALKSDGTVVAWGSNSSGQTTVPASLSGVTAVATGYSHTVALKSDGTVVAWGNNGVGQTTVPTSLSGVTAVATGYLHTVALVATVVTELNFAAKWNLAGNSVDAPLTVATTFADATKVSTVWKWLPATGKWAFYTPTLTDGGAAYAATKGYDFLTTINGGEGFWVNANVAFTASLPTGTSVGASYFEDRFDPAQNKLLMGWNLIATGGSVTPSAFNQALSLTPPVPEVIPVNVTTLWAWDNTLSKWYFYAPSLEANGGLASYIASKGYLDFATLPGTPTGTLSPTTGFWVKKP